LPISPKQKKKINREWWKRAQKQIPTAGPLRVNPGREEGKKNPKDPSVPLLHDAAAACAIPFFLSPQLRSPSPHLASPLFPCGAPLARRPGGASFRRRAAGRKSPREGEGISTGAADRQPGGGWGRMVSLSTWFRYAAHKFEYSISLTWKVLTDTFISLPPSPCFLSLLHPRSRSMHASTSVYPTFLPSYLPPICIPVCYLSILFDSFAVNRNTTTNFNFEPWRRTAGPTIGNGCNIMHDVLAAASVRLHSFTTPT